MTTGSTTAAATVHDVTMRYREHTALDRVTTTFEKDAITGLLGRNGAGKTTLMQLVTGHRVPTSGTVQVFGSNPYEHDAVLRDICFIKEGQRYPDHFRVRDALDAAAMLFPRWDADLAASLMRDFDLPAKRNIKKLSRGMTSAVGIIIGLASRAPLTVFDEPYLGLDAVARQLFYDRLIADYAENPRTVVLSTHLIEEIAPLLERVLLIDRGRVLLDADAESLRNSAVTVSGPGEKVLAFARQYELLHSESLGGHARAVVRIHDTDARRAASGSGLTVEPTNLQQLIVAMSLQSPAERTALHTAPTTDLEEVSR
ncbi:UNVERIFIED_ORG: ABC transporter ATP-binding protein [Bacillus sp. AZ43]